MEIKAKCIGLTAEGKGIVELDRRKETFNGLLPDELALFKKEKKNWELVSILERNPQRIQVECPHFKKCGACQFQHCSLSLEEEFKQKQIESLFPKMKVNPIITMDSPRGYRHKVIATFSQGKDRKLIAGIYEEESHKVCAIDACLIQDQRANEIIQTMVQIANKMKIQAYNEDKKTGFFRHCLIRTSYAKPQVLVCLVTGSSLFPGSKQFISELRKKHPEVTTIIQNINSRKTSVVLGQEEKILYGTGLVQDELCGLKFLIGSKTFYQVNPKQTEVLYTTALKMAKLTKEEVVLDAYCGIGTISLLAAQQAKNVVGVEINKNSIQNAISNAKNNALKNVRFIAQDCGQYMLEAAARKTHFDVVIMDPAREGSDENFLKSLVTLKPNRLVYISCGPTTQKRDVDYLLKNGYRITEIQPVDLFPRTFHTENIILMSKSL